MSARGSLVKALLARIEAERCAQDGHKWEPVLGGGQWCRVCQAYEPRIARGRSQE